jgi:hypothetical protein
MPAARARAAALISESIGIPPHLSLPPFDAWSQIYRTTTNQRRKGDERLPLTVPLCASR